MSIEMKTNYGHIEISNETIAQICGGAAVDCYGIVGMASKIKLRMEFQKYYGKKIIQKASL